MLNTAIGLFGIHYTKNLNHWMGWNHTVDYSYCIDNNKEYVFNNYNSSYYSSTYFSEKIPNLISDFDFIRLKLKPLNNKREVNYYSKNISFKETIELILESNIEYDLVILMRYDMIFHQNINDLNIDYNKINMLCLNKCGHVYDFCDDSFYLIPFNKLQNFYDIISSLNPFKSSHEYNRHIPDINYMVEGQYYSHEYPMYHILRIPL